METIVMVALSSVASVSATYLFMQVKNGAEKISDYQPMSGRQRQLTGTWIGESTKQRADGQSVHYKVQLDIEAAMRQTSGYGRLEAEHDGVRHGIEIEILTGGFLHDQYLKVDYRSDAKHKAHFGTIIGSLDPSGTTIEATISGFSELLGSPGTGQLTLKKA